jgi:DNA-binding MurR/RpiR family transcriptional regulator
VTIDEWLAGLDAANPTRVSRQILGVLAAQPERASYASVAQIGTMAGVDLSSVTRVAQAVGFTGWPALRAELRARFLRSLSLKDIAHRHADADPDRPVARSLDADRRALALLDVDHVVVARIAEALAAASGRIAIGGGSFAAIAHVFASNLSLAGYPTSVLSEAAAVANAITRMGPGDVVVAFDFWRLYEGTALAAAAAARRGATVCVVTDHASSELTSAATHVMLVPSEGGSYFPTLVAAIAAANLLCTHVATLDPDRTDAAIAAAEAGWTEMRVMRRGE